MSRIWPEAALGDLLKRHNGVVALDPSAVYREITVRLWGKGVVLRRECTGAEIASDRRTRVRAGQLVLSRIDARHGAIGLVPDSLDGAVVSSDFPVFDLNESKIVPRFLEWMTRTPEFVKLCQSASEGTTNRVRLKEDRFLQVTIPLPPLEEQRRIVARIEELATKIEEARGLRHLVLKGLRDALQAQYVRITRGAPSLPFGDVAPLVRRPVAVETSGVYPELGIRSFGKGPFHKPALTGAEVGSKRLFRIESGDLLFNIVFAWEGAVAVARSIDHGRVGSHRFLTCVPKTSVATSQFLRFHFLTEDGLRSLGEASPGGAGRNRTLGLQALSRIPVPVPPMDRQLSFDRLQHRAELVTGLYSQSDVELDALLSAILERAFKGEL